MSVMVVPIGHSVGPQFPSRGQPEPDSYDIRYADGVFSVDEEEMRIWALSHGDPQYVAANLPTRRMVYESAGDMGLTVINQTFDRLRDVGLVAEFDPDTSAAVEFARKHQVIPLTLGLGNTIEQPHAFTVGLPGEPRVVIAADAYYLWTYAHRHPTFWDACRYLAADRQEDAKRGARLETDPVRILRYFLAALPAMLATASAYVDRAR